MSSCPYKVIHVVVSTEVPEDDDNNNVVVSHETICSDPYCNCPCHKKEGDSPPPEKMGGYYGEGATQYARWPHY